MARHKKIRDKYFINLNGQKIEVSQEVYYAWYGGERQERYQEEKDSDFDVKPFSALGTEDTDILEILASADDVQGETESRMIREELTTALGQLPPEDRKLIYDLFYQEKTLTSIAKEKGVSVEAVWLRKKGILKKLRNYFGKK